MCVFCKKASELAKKQVLCRTCWRRAQANAKKKKK